MNTRRRLDEMISGYRATQIIRTAVQLCIPEALANGPLTSVDVAERLGLDQHALVHRLMRCLAAFGVLVEKSDGRFANSEMGALLLPGAPGGLRDAAVGRTVDDWREAWGALYAGIMNGRVPFEIAHGRTFWTANGDPASRGERRRRRRIACQDHHRHGDGMGGFWRWSQHCLSALVAR